MNTSHHSTRTSPPTRILLVATCVALLAVTPAAAPQPALNSLLVSAVRISQVYGGGGNTGATLKSDFIELFNAGPSPINLNGWSVQYASYQGFNWSITPLGDVTIPAFGYLLIKEADGTGGSNAGTPLENPDVIGSITMNATRGKVALASGTASITGKNDPTVVDFVGYGTGTNEYEGDSPAPQLSNTTAALRANGGCTDTDQNGSDFTSDVPNPRNSSSPTHACGDAAPTISNTIPTNGATSVAVDSTITITFSEDVDVAGDWFAITCTLSGAHTATVSGGPQSFTLDPVSDFITGDICTVTVYAGQITDQDTVDPPDQMTADYTWSFYVIGACSTIPLVQGSGTVSPCASTAVADVQGCITGVAARGFYFQDLAGDGDPQTSDGLFVYRGSDWTNPEGLAVGDLVSVSGQIAEFYNTTEFQAPNTVTRLGSCTPPAPVPISPADPNLAPDAQYERYEAMRVSMSFDGWVVGATKRFRSRFPNGDPEIAFVNYGSGIPADSRVFAGDYPGYQGINYLSGGLNVDLPDLDFGDRVAGVGITGVLAYNSDRFQLLLDPGQTLASEDRPDVTAAEPRLNPANAEFDVCFFNVENLFDHLNDGQGDWGDWAPGWPTPGSAEGAVRYHAMLAARADVIVSDLQSCMVIGLQEVEGKQQVYDDLAAAMGTLDSTHTWTAAFVPSGDSRNITQGFLWRNDVALVGSVTPVSGTLYAGWVTDGVLDFVRTIPTGLFRFHAGTPDQVEVHVYAVHFKSKRYTGSCTAPDCTDVRERETADLRDILTRHQAVGEYAIAGGDFNDILGSNPINILDASPAVFNLFNDLPARERWSYVFNGESQVLDYIYLTANLLPPGSGWEHRFNPAHVNADFPISERASDHDPVRARFGRASLCVIGDHDVNDDGVVNVVDVQRVAVDFGRATYAENDAAQTVHDVNCSGAVDVLDIGAVAGRWRRAGQ